MTDPVRTQLACRASQPGRQAASRRDSDDAERHLFDPAVGHTHAGRTETGKNKWR